MGTSFNPATILSKEPDTISVAYLVL